MLVTGAAEPHRSPLVLQQGGVDTHTHAHRTHWLSAPGNETLTDDESDAQEEEDHSKDQATDSQRLII